MARKCRESDGILELNHLPSPGNEDPITDGRWSSWQKVAVKLLNCSLVEDEVGITEVNALVGALHQVFESLNYCNFKDNRITWSLIGTIDALKKVIKF